MSSNCAPRRLHCESTTCDEDKHCNKSTRDDTTYSKRQVRGNVYMHLRQDSEAQNRCVYRVAENKVRT